MVTEVDTELFVAIEEFHELIVSYRAHSTVGIGFNGVQRLTLEKDLWEANHCSVGYKAEANSSTTIQIFVCGIAALTRHIEGVIIRVKLLHYHLFSFEELDVKPLYNSLDLVFQTMKYYRAIQVPVVLVIEHFETEGRRDIREEHFHFFLIYH